ncbi:MAG TPA: hypothetical protein VM735_05385 [Candidatus Kapabacteria bacterium]|nr:hypothetical protein [Candidatus Kapabacteria bacterium]
MREQTNVSPPTRNRPRFFIGFPAVIAVLLLSTFFWVKLNSSAEDGSIVTINFQGISSNTVAREKVAVFEVRNLRRNPIEIDSACVWEFRGSTAELGLIANYPVSSPIVVRPGEANSIQVAISRASPARLQIVCLERRTLNDKIRQLLPLPLANLFSGSRRVAVFTGWVEQPASDIPR